MAVAAALISSSKSSQASWLSSATPSADAAGWDPSPAPEGPVPTPARADRVLGQLARVAADFPVDAKVRSADPAEVFVLEMQTPPGRDERHAD